MGLKWQVEFHRRAVKDLLLLKQTGLAGKAKAIAEALERNPFETPPPYEKLSGDLRGCIPAASIYSTDWCTRWTKKTEPCACFACGRTMETIDGKAGRREKSRFFLWKGLTFDSQMYNDL